MILNTTHMDLINIFKALEKKEEFKHGEPQNDAQIKSSEQALGVKFPESYKEMLRRYGYICWSGDGIYGPSKDPYFDLSENVRLVREEELPDDFDPLPKNAFVIRSYAGGGEFMLFSADSPRAGQIGLFLSETFYHEEETWSSLEEYLEEEHIKNEYL